VQQSLSIQPSCFLCKEDQILVCIKCFFKAGVISLEKKKEDQTVELLSYREREEEMSTQGNY